MGLFDAFIAPARCPHCGVREELEFQTKQLGQGMYYWRRFRRVGGSWWTCRTGLYEVYGSHTCGPLRDTRLKRPDGSAIMLPSHRFFTAQAVVVLGIFLGVVGVKADVF